MKIKVKSEKLKVKSGFTLIELLVVISIIGILAALSLVSYSTAQKQARDTQRKSDLAQYRNILESYANKKNGLYVVSSAASPAAVDLCAAVVSAGILGSTTSCPDDPKYKSADPSPYLQYQYQTDSGGTKYALWAKLENTSGYWTVCSSGTSSVQSSPSISSCP